MSGGSSGQNYIVNGSFEDGYVWLTDDLQQPHGWQFTRYPTDSNSTSYTAITSGTSTGAAPSDGTHLYMIRLQGASINQGITMVQDIDFRGSGRISFDHITDAALVGTSAQKVSIIYQDEDLMGWVNEIVLHEGNGGRGTHLWNTSSAVINIPFYIPMIKLVIDVYATGGGSNCDFFVDNFVLT